MRLPCLLALIGEARDRYANSGVSESFFAMVTVLVIFRCSTIRSCELLDRMAEYSRYGVKTLARFIFFDKIS
jgi:hypothetical protein